ncbi:long-chain-alcohol O-fatty-acyltransferase-like, partial [Bidens hawaiensis]|uniref:long-chain-alcohol O-fatty-acyltransferase-like n=1 Tax=Bidens hawaiensis TaxID=980011 RepID=UPI0040493248
HAMATNNFIIYISSITLSLSYCYNISSKIPKGIYRFISIIPILYLFTILPLHFATTFPTAVTFAFTTWLTNFKLIRFAFDLDHSPFHPSISLIHFITYTSLPIKTGVVSASSPKRLRVQLVCQILVLAILVKILLTYGDIVHLRITSFIYGWILFLLIDVVAAVSNAILFVLTGLELEPSSDHPYLATSLQNFWARWNMLVTNTLRYTIYKPVVLLFCNYKWAPLAGVLSSFLVSGLMHELFVYQLSRAGPTWEMTLFFMIHGVCVVVEKVVKRVNGGRWRVPKVVATVLTVGFVVVTGVLLFIPPFIKGRVDVKMLQEYKAFAGRIKSKLS